MTGKRCSSPSWCAGGAVVTGAGRGLGQAVARMLHARGLTVHVTDVDAEAAARTARSLGGDAWASPLDITDAAACAEVACATAERAGSLSVWVNNAGVFPIGRAWDHDAEQRRRAISVNTLGTMNGTLAALAVMRPTGRGHVVNVISLAGLIAPPGEALYAASKHAALAFSVGTCMDLRLERATRIHVSALCPDAMLTPMLDEVSDRPEAALSWSGVMLSPERVAGRVEALLERPRPVLSVPRWRGGLLRAYAAWPSLGVLLQPPIAALAYQRQRVRTRRHAGRA